MIRSIPRVALIAAGLVVFAGTIGGGIVLAEGRDAPTPSPTTQAGPSNSAKGPKAYTDDFIQKLADNLHIDVQTLKDALKTTSLGEIDQAVSDGKIDQATADKIKTAINNGDVPGFELPRLGNGAAPGAKANGGPGGPGRFAFAAPADLNAIAGFLGTDVATLRSELTGGKTLAQAAEAHGKTRDELKTFLTDQQASRLAAAVTAGKITQAQADAVTQKFATTIDNILDQTIQPPPMGRGHKPATGNKTNPPTPTTGTN
jgi:hypothetical protein